MRDSGLFICDRPLAETFRQRGQVTVGFPWVLPSFRVELGRSMTRWEHEAVLEAMQRRPDRKPQTMTPRGRTIS